MTNLDVVKSEQQDNWTAHSDSACKMLPTWSPPVGGSLHPQVPPPTSQNNDVWRFLDKPNRPPVEGHGKLDQQGHLGQFIPFAPYPPRIQSPNSSPQNRTAISPFSSSSSSSLSSPPPPPIQGSSLAPHFLPSFLNSSEPAIPSNCSDVIRSMAAKYKRIEQYNAALQKLRQFGTSSTPIAGNPLLAPTTNGGPSLLPNALFSATAFSSGLAAASLGPPALGSQAPALAHPTTVRPPSSGLSSAELLLNMVKNARRKREEREEQLVGGGAADEVFHASFLRPLKKLGERVTPLDLSSSPPPAKRPRLESEEIDVETYEGKSEPSTPTNAFFPCNPPNVISSTQNHTNGTHQPPPKGESGDPRTPSTDCAPSGDPSSWSVEEVFRFVQSIDICKEYAEGFRCQRIDGWCLSLLTEGHLTASLGMALGPALKLLSLLRRRGCARCGGGAAAAQNNSEQS